MQRVSKYVNNKQDSFGGKTVLISPFQGESTHMIRKYTKNKWSCKGGVTTTTVGPVKEV